ncbi:hypothetical protein U8527_14070 [Kordia algicida OT-1]|uniref:Uncharacterized protein n=1 Tax=Kordia algicida OT-1 TaxID=391587 RepID=A9DXQ0_9FLAO|nr:hypothetical protein [Kordia algicida]EDP96031.1 hypothetical protein KAOT1_07678 [Kordia algicida OT-1]
MKIVINIKEIIITSVLFITLILPSCIQFSHQLLEEHEHVVCNEQSEHVHEAIVHCDLCDFNYSNFLFVFTSYPELQVSPIISKTTLGSTTPLCYSLPLTNKQLRAPPVYS